VPANPARASDGAAFARLLRRHVPGVAGVHNPAQPTIPSAPGELDAPARFEAHLRAAFGVTNVPLPPGAADPVARAAWLALYPSAPEPRLARAVAAWEVRHVLGWDAAPSCAATGAHSPACKMCVDAAARAAAHGGRYDLAHGPPLARSMTANTSAVCNGDIDLAHIVWPHALDPVVTEEYRAAMSTALATILSRSLADGQLPASLLLNRVVWLAKHARTKADVDHTAPPSYRAIFLAPALAKIADLVFTTRLSHWSSTHNIISAAHQGAYTAGLGGSWHLFATREMLRRRARGGRSTFLVFYDVVAAFDRIHPEALRILLLHAGVPQRLADYIFNTCTARRAVSVVNGVASAEVRCFMGSPQGGVSSGLHMGFFMEFLSRYLASLPDVAGVEFDGARLVVSIYADDVSTPSDDTDVLQRTVDDVNHALTQWGFELNTGAGKTEVMAVLCNADAALRARLPTISIARGGARVALSWVREYKYLGYILRDSLVDSVTGKSIVDTLAGAHARVFGYNGTLHRLPPAVQVEIFKTYVLSSVAYWLPFVNTTDDAARRIDAFLAKFARRVLNVPDRAPTAGVLSALGLSTAWQMLVGARVRLALSLALAQHRNAPAVVLFTALSDEPQTRRSLVGPYASWVHQTVRLIVDAQRLAGAGLPTAGDRFSVSSVSAAFARRASYARSRAVELRTVFGLHNQTTARVATGPPRQVAFDYMFGFGLSADLLGDFGSASPLSVSAILGLVTSRLSASVMAISAARLGAGGLLLSPLGPPSWRPPSRIVEDADWHTAHYGRSCPFCHGARSADVWHVLSECSDLAVVAACAALRVRAAAFVSTRLIGLILKAAGSMEPARRLAARAHAVLARASLPAFDWDSPSGAFLLYRLVLALPYPACVVTGGDGSAAFARHFGALLDSVYVRSMALRQIANAWTRWAGRELLAVTSVWSRAVTAQL
jgi:hypothetical protein